MYNKKKVDKILGKWQKITFINYIYYESIEKFDSGVSTICFIYNIINVGYRFTRVARHYYIESELDGIIENIISSFPEDMKHDAVINAFKGKQ